MHHIRNTISFAIFGSLLGIACVDLQEPSAPNIVIEGNGQGETSTCDCEPENISGKVFRFSRLAVDQPARLGSTLDGMWEYEITNYLLNVLFRIDTAEKSDGVTAFSKLQMTVGPAWRTPAAEYSGKNIPQITSYCFMDDALTIDMEVTPANGHQCRFRNKESHTLFFHLGPQTDPLMCGPLLSPANSTPINDLHVTFGFNGDCSAIPSGYLDGCLPQDEVNKICMCVRAGTCSKDGSAPQTVFPTPPSDPFELFPVSEISGYCASACGAKGNWATFRGIMDSADIAPTCVTSDKKLGYRLSAYFEAEDVTSLFSNVVSADCSGI